MFRLCLGRTQSKLGFKLKGTDQFLSKQDPCLHLPDRRLFMSPSVSLFSVFVFTEGEGIIRVEKTIGQGQKEVGFCERSRRTLSGRDRGNGGMC